MRASPIYLRAKGEWGEPSSTYTWMKKYMPFFVIAAVIFGLCGGLQLSSSMMLLGGPNTAAMLAGNLFCSLTMVERILYWVAILLTPALVGTQLVEERRTGAWDILRLTPFSTQHFLEAKLLGGLARLPIWKPLIILQILQICGMGTVATFMAIANPSPDVQFIFWTTGGAFISAVRTWTTIIFMAQTSILAGSLLESVRGTLVASYAVGLGQYVVIGGIILTAQAIWADSGSTPFAIVFYAGATIAQIVLVGIMQWLVRYRGRQLARVTTIGPREEG